MISNVPVQLVCGNNCLVRSDCLEGRRIPGYEQPEHRPQDCVWCLCFESRWVPFYGRSLNQDIHSLFHLYPSAYSLPCSPTSGMKRIRSQGDSPGDFIIYEDEVEEPLDRRSNTLISPSKDSTPRPSKIRRHGSKILSVLRSLTNSGKSLTSPSVNSPLSGKTCSPPDYIWKCWQM